ncbi:hypothetical protein BaRGS_00003762 [Batillaria attramentaria]|uniref:Uncharacterized protein n=1 Tax=Batillaria attramentaria TaxID=370345 RepID=A0ABD0LZ54_9CAEN
MNPIKSRFIGSVARMEATPRHSGGKGKSIFVQPAGKGRGVAEEALRESVSGIVFHVQPLSVFSRGVRVRRPLHRAESHADVHCTD